MSESTLPTDLDVRSSSRHAFGVQRYHVWPMNQRQNTAEHTFHMLRIYWCIWGPLPPATSTHIIWHDAGESDTGDVQFGAKRRYPELKKSLDAAEDAQIDLLIATDAQDYGGPAGIPSETEKLRAKACDLLEGWEFALTDVARGNRLAIPVVDAYWGGITQHFKKMTSEDEQRVYNYMHRPYGEKLIQIYRSMQ